MSAKKDPTVIPGFAITKTVIMRYNATILHNTEDEPTVVTDGRLTLMVWEIGTSELVATVTFENDRLKDVPIAGLKINYIDNLGYLLILPDGHYVSGKVD